MITHDNESTVYECKTSNPSVMIEWMNATTYKSIIYDIFSMMESEQRSHYGGYVDVHSLYEKLWEIVDGYQHDPFEQ